MTNAGMWFLIIFGVVLLLCGCCSIMPLNADRQSPADGDRVALMTQLAVQLGCIIGGLICLGVALRRYTTVTRSRASAVGPGGSAAPVEAGHQVEGGGTGAPYQPAPVGASGSAPAAASGTGTAWVMLVLGIVLLLGSCFLGSGVGIIAGILATDPPGFAGPYVVAGVLALTVVAGLVLGVLAIRAGYRKLR